jgi:outer membrane assembly lipoprotein YfiO
MAQMSSGGPPDLHEGSSTSFVADDPLRRKLKDPSAMHRPAMATAENQLAYANGLREEGELKKAADAFDDLVHEWHDTTEAVQAQMAYAEIFAERGKYRRAFIEYQYMIDFFAIAFPFDEVLQRQARLAHTVLGEEQRRGFFRSMFRDPTRALIMFDKVVANAPNWEGGAEIRLTIAGIKEANGDMLEAMTAYERVQQFHPKAPAAEEAAYRKAVCVHRIADENKRDEAKCRQAMSAFASFLSRYPASELGQDAEAQLDGLRLRLSEMYYERADYYDRIARRPAAAILAYRDYLRRFPSAEKAGRVHNRIKELEQLVEEKTSE